MVGSARKSLLGKRNDIPRPIPIQPPSSTINVHLGTDMLKSARKSMLGKRKNISRPIPIQPSVSTKKRHLGRGAVKDSECVNLPHARRKLWSPSEEKIRNHSNKDQGYGPQKKNKISAVPCNTLTSAVCKYNAGSVFENGICKSDTKENVSVQCLQHIKMKTPVSFNKVGTSWFGSRPFVPYADLLLKSNASQNGASVTNLSAGSVKFIQTSSAYGSAIRKPSQIPKLLKSKIPSRSTMFISQLPTKSGEVCETCVVSNSEGKGINYIHSGALNCNRSKRTRNFQNNYTESEFYEKSTSDVTGALDESKYLISQKLERYVHNNESEGSSKIRSHGGTSEMVSNRILTHAVGGAFAISVATQTDLVIKNNAALQTDSAVCVKSDTDKLLALIKRLLKHMEQLGTLCKKQEDKMHALLNQTGILHNEVVNVLNNFSDTEEDNINSDRLEERNNHASDEKSEYSHNNSDECSKTPLRRSARIAAQTTCALAAGSVSVPSTPVHLESDGVAHYSSEQSIEAKLTKSASVYKELCSHFNFLKTPQSRRRPLTKTPNITPNQILKRHLKDQIQSLYS